MGAWKLLVYYFFPPPLVLLIIMILPQPKGVRKAVVLFARNVLFFPVFGGVRLVHFGMAISGMSFAGVTGALYKSHKEYLEQRTPNKEIMILAKRWREERNFWIAFMCFFLWCVVYRFFYMALNLIDLQDQLAAINAAQQLAAAPAKGTAAAKTTAQKAASQKADPKEVELTHMSEMEMTEPKKSK